MEYNTTHSETTDASPDGRTCKVCKQWKPSSEFYRSVGCKFNLHPNCKACFLEKQAIRFKARYQRKGKVSKRPIMDRIMERVIVNSDGCWIWQGAVGPTYGQISFEGKPTLVHRLAYEHSKGTIPEGLHIDHLCRTRLCVNPEHLEAVTMQENIRRGDSSSVLRGIRTTCLHGHEYDAKNKGVGKRGNVYCRQCARERTAAAKASKRALVTRN